MFFSQYTAVLCKAADRFPQKLQSNPLEESFITQIKDIRVDLLIVVDVTLRGKFRNSFLHFIALCNAWYNACFVLISSSQPLK